MKDKLLESLFSFAALLVMLCIPLFSALPFAMLGLPWWAVALLLVFVLLLSLVPIAGKIVRLAVWVWSFVLVLPQPIGFWTVLYYIAFACYGIKLLFPLFIGAWAHLLSLLRSKKAEG